MFHFITYSCCLRLIQNAYHSSPNSDATSSTDRVSSFLTQSAQGKARLRCYWDTAWYAEPFPLPLPDPAIIPCQAHCWMPLCPHHHRAGVLNYHMHTLGFCIYQHTHIYIHTQAYMYGCACICIYLYIMYVYMWVCIHINAYVCMCIYIFFLSFDKLQAPQGPEVSVIYLYFD